VRPENSVRDLQGARLGSAGIICDNPMTDSGPKAHRSEVMSASTLGLFLADAGRPGQTRDVRACRIRRTEYVGGPAKDQDLVIETLKSAIVRL